MDNTSHIPALPSLERLDLDRIEAALLGLTQYHRKTKKDVVRKQLDAIEAALSRGAGYAAVAGALTDGGCAIHPPVLRKYLSQLRRERTRGESRSQKASTAVAQVDRQEPPPVSPKSPAVAPEGAAPIDGGRRSLRRSAFLSNDSIRSDE